MPQGQRLHISEKGSPISARDLIGAYFGTEIRLQPKETILSVGTSVIAAGTLGNQRVGITFSNPGTQQICIGLTTAITATTGLVVPQGGFISFNWWLDGEMVMQQFYTIAAASSQTLYMYESVMSVVN